MYSTQKNIILKKVRFVIAGIMLITILPGNAGEKNDGMYPDNTYPEFLDDALKTNLNRLKNIDKSGEFVSPAEVLISPDSSLNNISEHGNSLKSHSISRQNCREISSSGKSFNFYMNIQ
jgi:hypothetical protein